MADCAYLNDDKIKNIYFFIVHLIFVSNKMVCVTNEDDMVIRDSNYIIYLNDANVVQWEKKEKKK